jgi:hypothetical protein
MNALDDIDDLLAAADCQHIHAVYAGIGARKTPRDVLALMTRIARKLEEFGWLDRGGGAHGADEAFDHCVSRAEVFLPWPGFAESGWRKHPLPKGPTIVVYERPTIMARDIAANHHPTWDKLSDGEQKLMARNTHEILGRRCDAPCSMVICWTPDGSTGLTSPRTGGTGQAIRIAAAHKIPIFNLQRHDHLAAWRAICAL